LHELQREKVAKTLRREWWKRVRCLFYTIDHKGNLDLAIFLAVFYKTFELGKEVMPTLGIGFRVIAFE
jgi:hypothetical protein